MTATATADDLTQRTADLRAEAVRRLEKAARLRAEADEEERAGWRANATAVRMAGRLDGPRPMRRPAVSGDPRLARNRVISIMEIIGIDQPVPAGEGLHNTLRHVEAALGIVHAPHHVPPVGRRIAICESCIHDGA